MVQKEDESSSLAESAPEALLVPTTAEPVTDTFTKKIGSRHREHVAENATPLLTFPQRGKVIPPA